MILKLPSGFVELGDSQAQAASGCLIMMVTSTMIGSNDSMFYIRHHGPITLQLRVAANLGTGTFKFALLAIAGASASGTHGPSRLRPTRSNKLKALKLNLTSANTAAAPALRRSA